MARVSKKCVCGYTYFTTDAHAASTCPSCGRSSIPLPPAGVISALPPSAPRGLDRKTLLLAVGGAGLAVLVIVVLAVVLRGGGNKFEDEVERESKRALATAAKAPGRKEPVPAPAAAPKAPAPVAVPVQKPAPAAAPVPGPAPAAKPANPAPTPVPKPGPAPAARPTGLSPELLGKLKLEVLALPPFYLKAVLAGLNEERLMQIAGGAPPSPEEVIQVNNLLNGPRVKAVQDDQTKIRERHAQAEAVAGEGLPLDRVKMKDGRVLQCKIVEEGTEIVKVERRLTGGVGGNMNLRRDEIAGVEKGKGIGSEWAARWEAARKGTLADRIAAYEWCKVNTLTGQARLLALVILQEDPSHAKSREEADLPGDPVRFAEEMARGGIIVYQGKNWGAQELKLKLLKDGYEILDGKWVKKNERIISVPGLFRYMKQEKHPVQIVSTTAPMTHDEEITVDMVVNASGGFDEVPRVRQLRRFFAPPLEITPVQGRGGRNVVFKPDTDRVKYQYRVDMGSPAPGVAVEGEVQISIPIGEPVLEASVMTKAEIKSGGSITVYLDAGAGQRVKAYTCAAKEEGMHKLPDAVRGMTQIELVASLKGVAKYETKTESRVLRRGNFENRNFLMPGIELIHHRLIPDYGVVLFPSNENTFEVFRLKALVAEPMPVLDKLFEGCPELLR